MRFFRVFLLLALVAVVGCSGGQPASSVEPTADDVTQELKEMLESFDEVDDEEILDAAVDFQDFVESDLAEADAAKAESLKADAEALGGMTSPAEIKAKAKEILDKL